MAQTCPHCGICTCTGTYLVKANNGLQCCTACVNVVNQQIAEGQIVSNPEVIKNPPWQNKK